MIISHNLLLLYKQPGMKKKRNAYHQTLHPEANQVLSSGKSGEIFIYQLCLRHLYTSIIITTFTSVPAGIYLLKVNNRNTRTGVKYVQS